MHINCTHLNTQVYAYTIHMYTRMYLSVGTTLSSLCVCVSLSLSLALSLSLCPCPPSS